MCARVKQNFGEHRIETNLNFVLSHIAIHNPEMIAAIVYAKQRLGKSVYALQVGYDIYRDWDVVLDHTVFQLEDVLDKILCAVEKDVVIPYLIWDDTGVHGNKYLFFTNHTLTMMIQGLFDVVGTAVKCFIMTTPNPGNLLKAIRDYEFYRIKITKMDSRDGRIATGYPNILLPSGTRNIRKEFQDFYRVKIPDDIYARYVKIRKSYTKIQAGQLREYLNAIQNPEEYVDLQTQVNEAYNEVVVNHRAIKEKMR